MRPFLILALATGCAADDQLSETTQSLEESLVSVTRFSPLDGTATKQIEMVCPLGKVGLQPGFGADNGMRAIAGVAFTAEPAAGGQRWRIRGTNYTNTTWELWGVVRCVDPPFGYELVTATTVNDASLHKELTLACPAQKVELGAAFLTTRDVRTRVPEAVPARITQSMPSPDGTSRYARAGNLGSARWRLQGTAVCVDPVPGYEVVIAASGVARCQAGKAWGGGWSAYDDAGPMIDVALIWDYNDRPDRWVTSAERDDGSTAPWHLEQASICAL